MALRARPASFRHTDERQGSRGRKEVPSAFYVIDASEAAVKLQKSADLAQWKREEGKNEGGKKARRNSGQLEWR